MKKLLLTIAIAAFGYAAIAQTDAPKVEKKEKAKKEKTAPAAKTEKTEKTAKTEKAPAAEKAAAAPMKKDGTPDMRFKANKEAARKK